MHIEVGVLRGELARQHKAPSQEPVARFLGPARHKTSVSDLIEFEISLHRHSACLLWVFSSNSGAAPMPCSERNSSGE